MAKKTPVHHTPPDSYFRMWDKELVLKYCTFDEKVHINNMARQLHRDRKIGAADDDEVYRIELTDGRIVLIHSIDRLEIEG